MPVKVINRVLECFQEEQQQVLWQGQLSRAMLRRRGIKQGCPLSPYIFNLLMEAVLESVEDVVPGLRLNQEGYFSYPMLLAFADDLIIISRTTQDVELVLRNLVEFLSYVDLDLNEDKCKVLIRQPIGDAIPEIAILGRTYKTTEPLRYLGVFLTAKLERPMTVRTRCRKAVRLSKVVLGFLKKYRPSWKVAQMIYGSVIAPSMLYGTQVAVLTKYSRRSIRGYERQIVQSMAKLCRDTQHLNQPVSKLLSKKRITKKIRLYQMRWFGHVRRRPANHPLRVALNLRARRLRSCRPGFTMWDMIKQNISRYGNADYQFWWHLALDKEKYNQELQKIYEQDESDSSSWGKTVKLGAIQMQLYLFISQQKVKTKRSAERCYVGGAMQHRVDQVGRARKRAALNLRYQQNRIGIKC